MKESFLYEADDESGRYEDGETWKTAGGQVGGKYKGEIDYFDDEGAAKEFAKTGERGGESGDAASGGDTKQTGTVFQSDTTTYDDQGDMTGINIPHTIDQRNIQQKQNFKKVDPKYAPDDDATDRIKTRNNPQGAGAFTDNPYADKPKPEPEAGPKPGDDNYNPLQDKDRKDYDPLKDTSRDDYDAKDDPNRVEDWYADGKKPDGSTKYSFDYSGTMKYDRMGGGMGRTGKELKIDGKLYREITTEEKKSDKKTIKEEYDRLFTNRTVI